MAIQQEAASNHELLGKISTRVVQITREHTGRGPTQARTYMSDNLVAVVLQETLIKAERSLVQGGKGDMVRTVRRAFQDTMREDMVAAVEALTGRPVVAFFSDSHLNPDIAIESFLLEALDGSDPAAPPVSDS